MDQNSVFNNQDLLDKIENLEQQIRLLNKDNKIKEQNLQSQIQSSQERIQELEIQSNKSPNISENGNYEDELLGKLTIAENQIMKQQEKIRQQEFRIQEQQTEYQQLKQTDKDTNTQELYDLATQLKEEKTQLSFENIRLKQNAIDHLVQKEEKILELNNLLSNNQSQNTQQQESQQIINDMQQKIQEYEYIILQSDENIEKERNKFDEQINQLYQRLDAEQYNYEQKIVNLEYTLTQQTTQAMQQQMEEANHNEKYLFDQLKTVEEQNNQQQQFIQQQNLIIKKFQEDLEKKQQEDIHKINQQQELKLQLNQVLKEKNDIQQQKENLTKNSDNQVNILNKDIYNLKNNNQQLIQKLATQQAQENKFLIQIEQYELKIKDVEFQNNQYLQDINSLEGRLIQSCTDKKSDDNTEEQTLNSLQNEIGNGFEFSGGEDFGSGDQFQQFSDTYDNDIEIQQFQLNKTEEFVIIEDDEEQIKDQKDKEIQELLEKQKYQEEILNRYKKQLENIPFHQLSQTNIQQNIKETQQLNHKNFKLSKMVKVYQYQIQKLEQDLRNSLNEFQTFRKNNSARAEKKELNETKKILKETQKYLKIIENEYLQTKFKMSQEIDYLKEEIQILQDKVKEQKSQLTSLNQIKDYHKFKTKRITGDGKNNQQMEKQKLR